MLNKYNVDLLQNHADLIQNHSMILKPSLYIKKYKFVGNILDISSNTNTNTDIYSQEYLHKYFSDINKKFRRNFHNQNGGNDQFLLTSEKLNELYQGLNMPIIFDNKYDAKYVTNIYGEMTYWGVQKLLEILQLNSEDVFYDLGSGLGKIVIQISCNTPIKKIYGIEFYPERSNIAEKALKKLYKMYPELLNNNKIISFQIQNIKDIHYLNDATVIFMCSTCYPSELVNIIYEKIKNNRNLRYFIIHDVYNKLKTLLPYQAVVILPCSWSKNVKWYIYSKVPILPSDIKNQNEQNKII